MACLEKDRERRPADMGAVIRELDRLASSVPWRRDQWSAWWADRRNVA